MPKERGPKTGVLESLLKRVDRLEAKLREKNDDDSPPTTANAPGAGKGEAVASGLLGASGGKPSATRLALDNLTSPGDAASLSLHTPLPKFAVPKLFDLFPQAKFPLENFHHLRLKQKLFWIPTSPDFTASPTLSSMNPPSGNG